MAELKKVPFSELPPVAAAADSDEFAVNQGGVSKKVTRAQLLAGAPIASHAPTHAPDGDDPISTDLDHITDAGDAAALDVGNIAGTVAAGDHTHPPTDHGSLTGRDSADQHPTSAITGLDDALDGKEDVGAAAAVQANLDTHKGSGDHDGRYIQSVSGDPAPVLGGDLATNGNDIVVTDSSGTVYGRIKPLIVDGFVTWAGVDLEPDVAHGYSSFTVNGVDASQPSIGFSIGGAEAGWVGTAGIPGENGVMLHGNGLTTVRSGTGDVEIYASNGEVRLGESSLTGGLATNGNHIVISQADGTVIGAVADTAAGGITIAYATDLTYDATDGAVELLPGEVELHGTTLDIRSLDDGSGEAVALRSINGKVFAAALPPPSWSLSDTGTDVVDPQPSPGTWFEVPGLTVTTTASESIGAADAINGQVQTYWTNANNKPAIVEVGLGIDGAEPTIGHALPTLGKEFSGLITTSITATPGELPAGTVFTVWVRETGAEGNPVLDGSTGTAHTLRVSRESTGGGTGSTPVTERIITQTGVLDITVADNEHVIVSANGVDSITFDVAAPEPGFRTVGLLEIIGSDRGITSPNIPASDWPNGTVPDLSTGRHLVGCNRGETSYAMTVVSY